MFAIYRVYLICLVSHSFNLCIHNADSKKHVGRYQRQRLALNQETKLIKYRKMQQAISRTKPGDRNHLEMQPGKFSKPSYSKPRTEFFKDMIPGSEVTSPVVYIEELRHELNNHGNYSNYNETAVDNVTISDTKVLNQTKLKEYKWKEFNRNKFLEAFKKHILMALQIQNLSKEVMPLPDLPPLHDYIIRHADDPAKGENTFHASAKNARITGDDISHLCSSSLTYGCLKFDKLKHVKHEIKSATLWLYHNATVYDTFEVTIYTLKVKSNKLGSLYDMHEYLDDTVALKKDSKPSWISFKVTDTINKWIRKPHVHIGFGFKCKPTCDRPRSLVFAKMYPLLTLDLKPMPTMSRNTLCTKGDTRCCRGSLTADFDEIIPNIVRPEKIIINYCTGSCDVDPTTTIMQNNHTIMIQSYRWNTHSSLNASTRSLLEPCCVPIAYKTRSVLVSNHGIFTKYDIPNFSVTACGCL